MTKKIAFIGAPGCGKTTLCADIFVKLKKKNINAELIHEWIRNDIHANQAMTSVWEQFRTRQHQKDLEDAVPSNVDIVLCDAGTLTPYFYTCLYADKTDPRQRLVIKDMHNYLIDDLFLRRYDTIFYLPTEKCHASNPNILTDGTRYQTEKQVSTLEKLMELVLTELHELDNIVTLDQELDERADAAVKRILKNVGKN